MGCARTNVISSRTSFDITSVRSSIHLDAGLLALDAGPLARSQYPEGPATGHIDTGFSWFPMCLQANAEMVPKFPSCYYMPLM